MTNKLQVWLNRKSITFKVFIVTLLLLFLSSAIIYSTLYFFLPIFYKNYKKTQLDADVKQLVTDVRGLSFQDAKKSIDQFVHTKNVYLILSDDKGKPVYPVFISSTSIISGTTSIDPGTLTSETLTDNAAIGGSSSAGTVSVGASLSEEFPKSYVIRTPIVFKDQALTLQLNATLQPINEASQILLMLIPYIGLFILLVSVCGAYVYSRIISKPLLAINQAAKKMSSLDFAIRIEHKSTDEIGQLSSSLNEMSAKLQQAMEDLTSANAQLKIDMEKEREIEAKRRELYGILSHELKSPITAVKGQLDGMIHQIGIYRDRDTYLRRSYTILENMEQLVLEILQISKFEHQILLPKYSKANLSEMICVMIKHHEYFANEKNIQVIHEIEDDLYIYSDPNLIEKALKNVIHNAIVYSNPSEHVRIHLKKTGRGTLNFQVLNTGAHIPKENFYKIFEPFYRVEKSRNRNTGGSGLGLYIVKMVLGALAVDFSMRNTEQGVLFSADFLEKYT